MSNARSLHDKAARVITQLTALDAPVALALSGGRDSTLLAHLAHQSGQPLVLLHVHHHLRSSAHRDAAAARQIADALSLPLHCLHLDASIGTGGVQARASRLRREALVAAARQLNAPTLLTAHHGQDRVETFLHQIGRGAGLAAGCNPRRELIHNDTRIVRPLLDWSRDEIDAWLHSADLPHIEDPSNLRDSAARNRLRRNVAAPWLRMVPMSRIAQSLDDIEDAATALRALVAPHLSAALRVHRPHAGLLDRAVLARLNPPVRRAVLRQLMQDLHLPCHRDWLLRTADAIARPGVRRIPGAGISACIGSRVVLAGAGDPTLRHAAILDATPLEFNTPQQCPHPWHGVLGTLHFRSRVPMGAWHLPPLRGATSRIRAAGWNAPPHPLAADTIERAYLPILECADRDILSLRQATTDDDPGWVWTAWNTTFAPGEDTGLPFGLHHMDDDLG